MPRAKNTGRRLRFKNHNEVVDWTCYLRECKEKGIKPMCHSNWRMKRRRRLI